MAAPQNNPLPVPVRMVEVDGPDPTYVAAFSNFNVGVGATTEILTVQGVAGKNVRIVQVLVSATIAVAAQTFDLQCCTLSAGPTGGASSNLTIAQQSPKDPASALVTGNNVKIWTTAPTAGTLVAVQAAMKLYVPLVTVLGQVAVFNFGYGAGAKALILAGASAFMSLRLNGVTPANATSFTGYVLWTERDVPPNGE